MTSKLDELVEKLMPSDEKIGLESNRVSFGCRSYLLPEEAIRFALRHALKSGKLAVLEERELPPPVYSNKEDLDPAWVEEATKSDMLKAGFGVTIKGKTYAVKLIGEE